MPEPNSIPPSLAPQAEHPNPSVESARCPLDALLTTAGTTSHPDDSAATASLSEGAREQAGRYQLLGEIGRGGMGVVLRGHDPELGRELALKVLLGTSAQRPALVQRFREEAQIGGQLQHPGVVPVYELGRFDDGRPFFTMKLVKGVTFAAQLQERSRPAQDRPRCLKVFEQVCQAVAFAHSRRVIHRDLKPHNVMVGAFGEVQVMDWGLAKVLNPTGTIAPETECSQPAEQTRTAVRVGQSDTNSETQEGEVLGTPAYMAPEQALGEISRLDERCDVFSLGAMLCQILTGQPAYVGGNGTEVLRKARRGELGDALSRLDGCGADAELIGLAKRCLAAEPANRPRDAAEVADAVEAYLASVEERARQAETERAAAEVRAVGERRARKLTLALASAVLLLVAAGGAGAWLVQQQRAETVARRDKVREVLDQARAHCASGWSAADDRQLAESLLLVDKAEGIAGSDDESRRSADELRADIESKLAQAKKNGSLLVALLVVSHPPEVRSYRPDAAGEMKVLTDLPAEQQYAEAFRIWGVDVDGEPLEWLIDRLREQPQPVIDQVVSGLEGWFRDRQRRKEPEERWRKVLALADALDTDTTRRELRRLRAAGQLQSQRGQLLERARSLNAARESVLGVVTLTDTLLEVGEVVQAERVLRAALVERPGEVLLLNKLGWLLQMQSPARLVEAAEYYRAARARNPRLGIRLANILGQTKRAEEAEAILRKCGAGEQDHPQLCYYLGIVLHQQKKLAEAAFAWRKAIELKPDFAEAHNNLGAYLLDAKKPTEAEAALRKAIELQPNSALAFSNLGSSLLEQRKLGEAEGALRKAIELRPGFAEMYMLLGRALRLQKKMKEAEATFLKTIELQPSFAGAHNELGMVLREQNKLVEAETAYRKAIALQPGLAEAHVNLGRVLVELKKPAEAVVTYRKAIELRPELAEAYGNLGIALHAQQKLEEAEAAFRKAVELQPNSDRTHHNLIRLLLEQKKLTEAETACRKALELQPESAQVHNLLGATLLAQKNPRQAENACRKAIALQPNHALAHLNLGIALREQKKLKEAVLGFRKASELLPNTLPIRNALRQAELWQVLDHHFPDYLVGTAKAANPQEQLDLATFCASYKEHPHTAVRFFAAAFADPTLADSTRALHRYKAACAALQAASGKGIDAAKLDDKERTRLRNQALDWLRADLKNYGALSDKTPQSWSLIRTRLTDWLQNTDLAAVREEKLLAALPEPERAAWQQLWADVTALRNKIETKD